MRKAGETIRPIPVRVGAGRVGQWKFAARRLVDLQLQTIWSAIGPVLPRLSGRVLDVGCGEMPFRFAIPRTVEYVGIDVVEADAFGMAGHAGVVRFDGANIPFPEASFDGVLCTEVIEHASQPTVLVSEMLRVLKPGGQLVLTVPFAARVHHSPYDFHRFTSYGLAALFEAYADVEIRARGNGVATLANKLTLLVMQLLKGRGLAIWQVPLGLVLAPLAATFIAAAHAMLALKYGSEDDPLGYTVLARKPIVRSKYELAHQQE